MKKHQSTINWKEI